MLQPIHNIQQKPPFARAYKKLPPAKKQIVNEVILTIDKNPEIGTEKKHFSDKETVLAFLGSKSRVS